MKHFLVVGFLALSVGSPGTMEPQVEGYVSQQERLLEDTSLKEMDRVGALYTLRRIDPQHAAEAAARYLESPEGHLRFAAASTRAKAGKRDGEDVLLKMLLDTACRSGLRGLAAAALASVKSADGHKSIVATARRELEKRPYVSDAREASIDRRPFFTSLLEALAEYRMAEDIPLAKDLFQAAGPAAFPAPLGLFGSPDFQPIIRDWSRSQKNAASVIHGQLALARCGAPDGVSFVRELIRRGATIKKIEGDIDMEKEDPLSGRLVANELLADLGRHPSDRQFAADLMSMIDQGPCASCLTAWDALARVGTAGYEERLVRTALTRDRSVTQLALRVLAFNGASDAVRPLAKATNDTDLAEQYIQMHENGSDRGWFRGRARTID